MDHKFHRCAASVYLPLGGRHLPGRATSAGQSLTKEDVNGDPKIREPSYGMTAAKCILVVDDDVHLRHSLAEQLQLYEEFETVEAGNGAEALSAARARRFDAVLLDESLPDINGYVLCRQLRREGVRVPILLLTSGAPETVAAASARASSDSSASSASGASDSLSKPFRLGVLLARLRAQLNLAASHDETTLAIGPYTFRPAAKLMVEEGSNRQIRLTEKEIAILRYLYRARGAVIGREELLGEVWGYHASVTTHTLETHIYRLRKKLERDPANAALLVTEPGGYRLIP